MFIKLEWVPPIIRRRWREQPPLDNGERLRLGESKDERAARDQLRPRTGAVSPSVRDWLAGACGASYRKEPK